MKSFIKRLIPKKIFAILLPVYHYLMAFLGALWYRFPSKELFVIGITGTKGKSSTAEFLNAILESAGYKTALLSTIRFKIGEESKPNALKMTMPGLFFIERFLRRAVHAKCTHAILEMTSEGVKQFRHKHIALDALIFTNISPEHIESHGSFEKYVRAKLRLAESLSGSPKKHRVVVANADDPHGKDFLHTPRTTAIPYSEKEFAYAERNGGALMTYRDTKVRLKLKGVFNAMNALAAIKLSEYLGISSTYIQDGLESLSMIRGRVEFIREGQPFDVVVDYAHTPDSLEKLYETFGHKKKICVLGNTGGGRDKWKRPEMGRIAQTYCDIVILTNEDPYDEDPQSIVSDMASGMSIDPLIIMNRRKAIQRALELASSEDEVKEIAVLITGKGTDPYIMGARGAKTPWDDAEVVREELKKLRVLNKGA